MFLKNYFTLLNLLIFIGKYYNSKNIILPLTQEREIDRRYIKAIVYKLFFFFI